MSFKLFYAHLNLDGDIKEITFHTHALRTRFIIDKILLKKKVFLLAIDYASDDSAVYVFDKLKHIKPILKYTTDDIYLFEYSSFEEAYRNALDMMEPNPLCYEIDDNDININPRLN